MVAQILLPSLAANWAESNISKYGDDVQISIEAFPAIKLLFHRADEVKMTAKALTPDSGQSILGQLKNTERFSATVGTLNAGRAPLQNVHIEKSPSGAFQLLANLTRKDVSAALPPGVTLQDRQAATNEIPVTIGSALLGKGIDSVLSVETDGGAVVIRVRLPGALGLVSSLQPIQVFEDPYLTAERITMPPTANGWRFSLTGRVK